ncbi:MAG: hypothetical protein M4D80_29035 [Myxococcota bacterium]|nr:hypothetical protein [Myxococcota bacterium]
MKSLALLVLLIPAQASADCALMGLVPKVLTADAAVLAPGGGIVVGAVSEDRGSLESGDIAIQKAWTFVVPKGTITPAIESLAPGLAVYKTSADAFELKNEKGDVLATATRTDTKRDKLAAPKVKTLKYDAPMSRRSIVRVEVTVDGGAPAGAIALVLADAKGTPKSWGPTAGSVFYPYLQRDCLTLPNGTVPSKKGDKVTLFWVDAHGRKSAFTKPMTIK